MKFFFPLLLALVIFFAACTEENPEKKPAIGDNLAEQIFNITAGTDTVLTSENGTKIIIAKNTFPANVSEVEITFKEALTLAEMVKAGLTTTSHNKILSTGGMVYISATWNGKEVQLLNPIKIQVPASDFDENMKVFKGEIADNKINWSLVGDLDNYERSPFVRGKKIFDYYCLACHKNGQILIGPDLTGITKRQNKEWIYAFTRNSQQVINSGDIYAKALFAKYNSIIMPPQNLTDAQLDDLYFFIENDTPTQNPPVVANGIFGTNRSAASNSGAEDTGLSNANYQKAFAKDSSYYIFTVQSFGWYNCDKFIDADNTVEPKITVHFPDNQHTAQQIFLVLPKLKSVIPSYLLQKELQVYQLPKDEKAMLVFTNYDTGEPKYFFKTLVIDETPVTIEVNGFDKRYKDLESALK